VQRSALAALLRARHSASRAAASARSLSASSRASACGAAPAARAADTLLTAALFAVRDASLRQLLDKAA